MAAEHVVAQQFVNFLVDRITTKSDQIRKETVGESTKTLADEVNLHCKELEKAVSNLFAGGEQPAPPPPAAPQSNGNRRRSPNA